MTRINTNVSSLTAQKTLARSNVSLQQALTRLSTGLRINAGKDDPAGLIASEALRSDITATNAAISNSQKANQMIATADSALGQVSSLLNDIRGLVTEAANTGAMSDEQIAANQLQIDSSLDAINRIAQVTSFQGRRLLDGTLDFVVTKGTGSDTITDMQINQANLSSGAMAVQVDISQAAQTAQVRATVLASGTAGAEATAAITLADGGAFTIEAPAEGTAYNGVDVEFNLVHNQGAATPSASYSAATKTLTINVDDTAPTATAAIEAAITDDTDFTIVTGSHVAGFFTPTGVGADSPTNVAAVSATATVTLSNGAQIELTAATAGVAMNNMNIEFVEAAAHATPTASWNGLDTLTITVDDTAETNVTDIAYAISNDVAAQGVFAAAATVAGTYRPEFDNGTAVVGTAAVYQATLASSINNSSIRFEANATGTELNGAHIRFETDLVGAAAPTANWDTEHANTLTVHVSGDTATLLSTIEGVVNGAQTQFTMTNSGVDTYFDPVGTQSSSHVAASLTQAITGGALVFTASAFASTWDTDEIEILADLGAGAQVPTASYAATGGTGGVGKLTIHVSTDTATAIADIENAVNNNSTGDPNPFVMSHTGAATDLLAADVFAATALDTPFSFVPDVAFDQAMTTLGVNTSAGVNEVTAGGANAITGVNAVTAGGAVDGGGLEQDLTFQLVGTSGSQVFSFDAGTGILQIIAAINAVSDSTGVTASQDNLVPTTLELNTSDFGSDASVSVDVIEEGGTNSFTNSLVNRAGAAATRDAGTDVVGKINGISASGSANTMSVNTATLSMSLTVSDGSVTQVNMTIEGGGALFQLGPDVVSSQQARMGIGSVDSASLGGESGRLYLLGSGKDAALANDASLANEIVDQVINKVTALRGRLGAFQKASLESNIASLSDTVENLTAAQSSIRDADFAAESANLTRAQILVQSGTKVLAVANQAPQNVLALLQNM